MKNKIYFISSAPIEYKIGNYDVYDSFDLVSRGGITAPLKKEAKELINKFKFPFDINEIDIIYTANKGQTVDTAWLLAKNKKIEIIKTPYLDGVKFSMQPLISKEKFESLPYEESIKIARREFLIKLFNNDLMESFDSVKLRINKLMNLLNNSNDNILCISHGFYMKLIEIYFNNFKSFDNLDILIEAFNPDKKPYNSLEGFVYEI